MVRLGPTDPTFPPGHSGGGEWSDGLLCGRVRLCLLRGCCGGVAVVGKNVAGIGGEDKSEEPIGITVWVDDSEADLQARSPAGAHRWCTAR